MSESGTTVLLVITGRDVRHFLDALIASIAHQDLIAWRAVFVDDFSSDGTAEALRSLLDAYRIRDRFEIVENNERQYKARNVFQAVRAFATGNDIVVIVDADDHLAVNHALDRLAREYQQGWEVVWSNWRGSDNSQGGSSHLNPFISPRKQPHLASHLFSFRGRLFDAVTASDLQDDTGEWFQAGCDVAIALPILDQTIKRKHIEEVLYVYNRANPLSHDKAGAVIMPLVAPLQARTSNMLRRRPPKPLAIDNEFLHSHLYEFMEAAMLNSRVHTRYAIATSASARRKT